ISLFDEVSEKSDFSGLDTPFDEIRKTPASDIGDAQVTTEVPESFSDIDETIREPIDRTDRPQRSALADMTPDVVELKVSEADESLEPVLLSEPEGVADDLKLISGIGVVNENELNRLGIFHYWQIASWNPEHVRWLTRHLHFAPRIVRENWISQAARLAQKAA
ncbi:MAG: hypothetical protein AAGC58_04175, partial [Asticcacaulis sp.]